MFVCAHPARRDLPEQGIDFLRGRRNRSTLAAESPFSSVDSHLLVLRDFDIGSHFVLLPSFVLLFSVLRLFWVWFASVAVVSVRGRQRGGSERVFLCCLAPGRRDLECWGLRRCKGEGPARLFLFFFSFFFLVERD